ncbi:hypothetical protein AB0J72_47880 [Dactylosporangium sp. NPDC049742]|uniref:hypothetical protein n=1 Tax=Dactylosporangium sp. NPDC049742 TaxID=3154737 RepID=UPI0034372741
MSAIDWAVLGSVGGDGVESFAAACLRQRYPDAIQTRPAQGDGGIDVYRETAEGLVVWQIKKFTTPLDASQKRQIIRSWKRFWDTHVVTGATIARYHLATPWTPTDPMQAWFKTKVVAGAGFPCQWDGAAFFDALSADYPATYDRFFKGPDMLNNLVLAKAVLAGSPIESGEPATMLAAARCREDAVRTIRDLASDTYYVNSGTVSTRDGSFPLPGPNDAGVAFRYESLGDNRFRVESVVPKTAQSLELDPIQLELRLQQDADARDMQSMQDWQAWGIPFTDVRLQVQRLGGPLGGGEPSDELVSFVLSPAGGDYPNVELRTVSADGSFKDRVVLRPTEVTHGVAGDGLRIVAASPSAVFGLEARMGSSVQPDRTQITFLCAAEAEPALVQHDLAVLAAIGAAETFEFAIENGPALAAGCGLPDAPIARMLMRVAAGLAELQHSSTASFAMPDIAEVTHAQLEQLERLVDIYRGNAVTTTWSRLVLTITEDGGFDPTPIELGHFLCVVERPTFWPGSREYQVTKRLARTYTHTCLAAGVDPALLRAGDEVELVPGTGAQLVVAMIVDDNVVGAA